ncbi:hypothetical protein AEAC466_17275 [Asticcacaulis sp. AC466]|nr:hypothetical protein AEAC466_17275 [Asticcacaulis sp. AC466]
MQAQGLSNYALADRVGVSEGSVRQAANLGTHRLGADTIYNIARELGTTVEALLELPPLSKGDSQGTLPVRYRTGGGVWIEAFDFSDVPLGEVEGAPVKSYPRTQQWYEKLEGDSMNVVFPDGTYLQVVDAIAIQYVPKSGDVVIVERTRDAGFLRERSAKQVEIGADGTVQLWPRSTNPRWQQPIQINDHPTDETVQVRIAAKVVRAIIDLT